MRRHLRSARHMPRSVLAVALAATALLLVLVLEPGGHQFTKVVDNLAGCAASLLGGAVCFWRCRGAGNLRNSFAALGVGLVGWGVGQSVWSVYELVMHREVPFPSPADAGFLTFPVAAAVALLCFPRGRGLREAGCGHCSTA